MASTHRERSDLNLILNHSAKRLARLIALFATTCLVAYASLSGSLTQKEQGSSNQGLISVDQMFVSEQVPHGR